MMSSPSIRHVLVATAAASLLVGCNAVIGLGVVAVAGTAAVLASDCYDRITVNVFDGALNAATCDAVVLATRGDDTVELRPCYGGSLTAGTWTIRASLPGRVDAVSTLVVTENESCGNYVQSIDLYLVPVGSAPSAPVPISPPRPPGTEPLPSPIPEPTAPAPASVGPSAPAPTDPGATPPPPAAATAEPAPGPNSSDAGASAPGPVDGGAVSPPAPQ